MVSKKYKPKYEKFVVTTFKKKSRRFLKMDKNKCPKMKI